MPALFDRTMPRPKLAAYAAAALVPVMAAAALGAVVTERNLHWYAGLHKPSFRPPGFVFAPVWTVLYLLMAWAFFRILCGPDWMPDRPSAIRAYMLQLLLNGLWPVVFFGLHSPDIALGVIVALWLAVAMTIRLFGRIDRTAALVLVPYLLWVSLAVFLNLSVSIRN